MQSAQRLGALSHPQDGASRSPAPASRHACPHVPRRLGRLKYVSVRGVARQFPEGAGAALSWRQDADLSGLNTLTLGICYEALQR